MAEIHVTLTGGDGADSLVATLTVSSDPVKSVTTDKDGKATVQLEPGTYEISVTDPPTGFAGPPAPVEVETNDDAAKPVEVPLSALTITVEAIADPSPPDEVRAQTFPVVIRRSDVWRTDALVSIVSPAKIPVPVVGEYEVIQLAAPGEYGLPAQPHSQRVTVSAATPAFPGQVRARQAAG